VTAASNRRRLARVPQVSRHALRPLSPLRPSIPTRLYPVRSRMRRAGLSLVAVAVLATVAWADAGRAMTPEAKVQLDRGMQYFQSRDFTAAIAAFDVGYSIDQHPDFLYAKAQALRLGGDCRAAIASYRKFLETNPPEQEASLARGNQTKCEQLLATTRPDAPAAPQGRATVIERWRDVPPAPWWRDPPGLVLAGVGVLSLGAAGVLALRASGHADDATGADDLAGWQHERDAWRRDRTLSIVAGALGAAAATTAIVRFVLVDRREPTRVRVIGGRGVAGLAVEGTW